MIHNEIIGLIDKVISSQMDSKVLVIGDIILDEYIECQQSYSISEDTPCVKIERTAMFAGGAGNVAQNLSAMGINSNLVSVIGEGNESEKLLKLLDKRVETSFIIKCSDHEIPIKTRIFVHNIKNAILKIDKRVTEINQTLVSEKLIDDLDSIIGDVECIVVSDYGLGLVSEKLLRIIINKARCSNKHVIIDPRGDNPDKYIGASLITPNLDEFNTLLRTNFQTLRAAVPRAMQLLMEFDIESIILKNNKEGSVFIRLHEEECYVPALSKKNDCTIGAGDSLISAYALGICKGMSPKESFLLGNMAASIAVAKPFTYAVTLEDMLRVDFFKYSMKG
ncbi:Bifunctional protein HldE [compost metagenome]